jgi:hypothetical protein
MWLAVIAAVSFAASQPVFIYKWRDQKGNLHVTDRLEQVPKELREKFQKLRDEAGKQPVSSGAATVEPTRSEPPPPPKSQPAKDSGPSAYERLKARMALEKQIKQKAKEAREALSKARAMQDELAQERGNLAANPVLNAAQPARVERMQEIDHEIEELDKEAATELSRIADLISGAKTGGYPEEWVTGY